MAIRTVATVIKRDLYMDVGAYNHDAKKMVTYQIIITVPDDCHQANMKLLQPGANIGVCGVLSDISMHKEIMSIELDSITFLPCTDFSCKDEGSTQGSTGARMKCQLMSEKAKVAVVKKMKSGPIEAFTLEELGVGTSQSSVGSSPLPSAGPSQSTCSMTSSQSSIGSSISSVKGSTKKNV
ncbi:hypothetical protein FRC11_001585 [Ceratobasidium sp. 423]|nr:hypothetical protein FRC11_001585 [Ceratobasidium sp. 423]